MSRSGRNYFFRGAGFEAGFTAGAAAGFAAAFFVAAKDVSFDYPVRRVSEPRGAGTHGWAGLRALLASPVV